MVFDRGGDATDNIAPIRRRSRAKYRLNAHGVRVFTFHWNRFSSPVCWFNKLIARERGSSEHDGWPKTRGAPILYGILHGCEPRSGGGWLRPRVPCTWDFHPWEEFRTGFGDLSIRRDTPECVVIIRADTYLLNRVRTRPDDCRTQ